MSKTTTNGVSKKISPRVYLGIPKTKVYKGKISSKWEVNINGFLFAHVLIIAIVERNVKTKFK